MCVETFFFNAQLSHDTIEAYSAGWFDYICFVDWFCTVALPNCQKLSLEAKKVLIGDNLLSHFQMLKRSRSNANASSFACLLEFSVEYIYDALATPFQGD